MSPHNKPMHLARPSINPVSKKQRIAVAQSTADRYRTVKQRITLKKPPWEKDRAAGGEK